MDNWKAKWITTLRNTDDGTAPLYFRNVRMRKAVKKAVLTITAMGVYVAEINQKRVGKFILAPGWTAYRKRLQYQTYDVTDLIERENRLEITVGRGWYHTHIPGFEMVEADYSRLQAVLAARPFGLLAQLAVTYVDGSGEVFGTDERWEASTGRVRFSDIYHGEIFDAAYERKEGLPVQIFDGPWDTLIPQEGPEVREQDRVGVADFFITPKGEYVFDFGQNLTGYVEVKVKAERGEVVDLSFAEVMDQEGNFYTKNYREAKCTYVYICKEGEQTYKPLTTFCGFRYIRVNRFPGGVTHAKAEHFTAIAVHSRMKRTGYLTCSDGMLNRFFSNVIWSQKSNFLDVPTDCPQRDERLGWTGDVLSYIKAACLNYDVEQFFEKWFGDLRADQRENGSVGFVIPDVTQDPNSSAAWGDVAVTGPWEVYLAYGSQGLLTKQYESMCRWVDFITKSTTHKNLWMGGWHFGDWLALDAEPGSYRGASRDEFVASAYYAHSVSLVILAGEALGKDVAGYRQLYQDIRKEFCSVFPDYRTQTECALAARFRLAKDPKRAADQLAEMIREAGNQLQTGFVGTPHLLHALSEYGYSELAYTLLLRREYPSWLYPVSKDATTMWEHWDGIMENGAFWCDEMNSFNHYAYGSVIDWVYTVAAGIRNMEGYAGYEKVCIAPVPDERLGWLEAVLHTRHGQIRSVWRKQNDVWRYEIEIPVDGEIRIDGRVYEVGAGNYCYYSKIEKA